MTPQQQPASSPWGTGASPGRPALYQALRQWLDRGTVLLLLAVFLVGLVMTVLSARGGLASRPPSAKLGLERALRLRGWAVGPGKAQSKYAPRRAAHPGPSLFEKLFPAPVVSDGPSLTQRPVVAMEPLALLERADDDASAVTTVEAGEVVLAVKEMGNWVLIATQQDKRTVFGWTQRDRVRSIGDLKLPGGR